MLVKLESAKSGRSAISGLPGLAQQRATVFPASTAAASASASAAGALYHITDGKTVEEKVKELNSLPGVSLVALCLSRGAPNPGSGTRSPRTRCCRGSHRRARLQGARVQHTHRPALLRTVAPPKDFITRCLGHHHRDLPGALTWCQ